MSIVSGDAKQKSSVLRDETLPIVARQFGENSPRVLAPQTLVQIQRLLIRFLRDPLTFFTGLILPIFFLVVMNIVLGDAISLVTGKSALYGSVPLVMLNGAMNGASVSAVGIIVEQNDGLLARLWTLPVHRASGLLARISADVVRIIVNSIILLGVGLILGLRFEQGLLACLAWLGVTVMFGIAFASLVLTIALYWPSTTLVDGIVLVNSLTLFFCTGFVPLDQYPQWIQPVVEHQPLSCAIDAMRGLAVGGPVLEPVLGTVFWSGGIILACAVPMVFGYRRASMRG